MTCTEEFFALVDKTVMRSICTLLRFFPLYISSKELEFAIPHCLKEDALHLSRSHLPLREARDQHSDYRQHLFSGL